MKYLISRPINGIPINGKEYVLDENGNEIVFNTVLAAERFLARHGFSNTDIEQEGIEIEEMTDED